MDKIVQTEQAWANYNKSKSEWVSFNCQYDKVHIVEIFVTNEENIKETVQRVSYK